MFNLRSMFRRKPSAELLAEFKYIAEASDGVIQILADQIRWRNDLAIKTKGPKLMHNTTSDRFFHEGHEDEDSRSWLKAYVAHERNSESPPAFHYWTAVFTVAGALRRRVWIDQRRFQWTTNMYIVLVAPPGVAAKSTTMRVGLNLLQRVENIRLGPQSMTWQALFDAFILARDNLELPGLDPIPMSCLSIGIGELGTFMDPKNRECMDMITALWDGQKEPLKRMTRKDGELIIQNPWLNFIACTTPAWLKENFPEVQVGAGLTSRIIFVYGHEKAKYIAYPAQQVEDADYKDEETALLHDLQKIANLQGEYKLTRQAVEWGEWWYRHHFNGGKPAHLASGRFDGYLSRKQTHIHKLAMVLAASSRNELTITEEDLKEAEKQVSSLERNMVRVFDSIGVAQGARSASEVVVLIKNHGQISSKLLWQQLFNTMEERVYVESLKAAINAGQVTRIKDPNGGTDDILTYSGGK